MSEFSVAYPIFFYAAGFMFFILSIYEERSLLDHSLDKIEKTQHMIIIFLLFSSMCHAVAAITNMVWNTDYYELGYIGLFFFMISFIMMIAKVFDTLGFGDTNE